MTSPNNNPIDLRAVDESEPANCHLMPCRVEHKELSVKAMEYFWPTIRQLELGGDNEQGRDSEDTFESHEAEEPDEENPTLAASFRGRPLHGKKVALPAGLRGLVIGKDPRSTLVPSKKFHDFTYWNWDGLPKKDDEIMKALQWLKVSRAVHDD